MWKPRRLTALWAPTAFYRNSFTFVRYNDIADLFILVIATGRQQYKNQSTETCVMGTLSVVDEDLCVDIFLNTVLFIYRDMKNNMAKVRNIWRNYYN
jgi:hypothetical protein